MSDNNGIRWLTLHDWHMRPDGLAFFDEHDGELFRYPQRYKDIFSGPSSWVWDLSTMPSGARIRFKSDSSRIFVRVETWTEGAASGNLTELFKRGFELQVNGTLYSRGVAPDVGIEEIKLYDDPGDISNQFTIWLPAWKPVRVLGIGIDEGAKVEAPPPYALPKPIVTTGSSITHGACASRPSMTWSAQLARMLDLDLVNLGATGTMAPEQVMADLIREVDACIYLLKCAITSWDDPQKYKDDLPKFIARIRERRPDTPLCIIGPIAGTHHWHLDSRRGFLEGIRQVNESMLEVVENLRSEGDENLYGVHGFRLLGPDDLDGLADAVHPNDLGFYWIAQRLAPAVRRMLGLPED